MLKSMSLYHFIMGAINAQVLNTSVDFLISLRVPWQLLYKYDNNKYFSSLYDHGGHQRARAQYVSGFFDIFESTMAITL